MPSGVSFSVLTGIVTYQERPTVRYYATPFIRIPLLRLGSPCDWCILLERLPVDPDDDLDLISAGTDSQELCEGEPISNIIYEFSGGATSATCYWTASWCYFCS